MYTLYEHSKSLVELINSLQLDLKHVLDYSGQAHYTDTQKLYSLLVCCALNRITVATSGEFCTEHMLYSHQRQCASGVSPCYAYALPTY